MENIWLKTGMRFYLTFQFAAVFMYLNIQGADGKVGFCNLALHRHSSSSSEFNDGQSVGYSCNAVDDGTSQNYSVGTCFKSSIGNIGNPWWVLDLEQAHNIDEVKIFLREDDYENSKDEFRDVNIYLDSTLCEQFIGPPSPFETITPLNVVCGLTGRLLSFVRTSPGPLTFCEVQVYASDFTTNKPCPQPSQPWHCRDLYYGYTTKTATLQPEVKETSTFPQLSVTDSFYNNTCTCTTSGSQKVTNSSMIEIMAQLEEIINEIEVDKKETSLAKSKRICAVDNRTSARVTGFVGVLFLCIVFGSFVLFDVINYLS